LDDRRHIGLNFNWNALFHSVRRVAHRRQHKQAHFSRKF
jgi:hypothetical protein